jgi:hypothetical protein
MRILLAIPGWEQALERRRGWSSNAWSTRWR